MSGFFVPGTPVPKGSAKAFVIKGTNRAIVTQTNRDKQKPWASLISLTAKQAYPEMLHGPISLSLSFTMPRPKGHYGTGKNSNVVKSGAPSWHTSKPDLDKLVRCVKDALTGIVWLDDSQVVRLANVTKTYGTAPGVYIEVRQCPGL